MSDWSSQRSRRPWRWAVALIVAAVLIGGAFVVGRSTAPSAAPGATGADAVDAGSVSTTAPYPGPTTPSGTVVEGPTGSTPDGGGGWMTPQGGRGHGPAARTAAGVPYGYTQDADGAALAAVNGVVGGLWFNPSFPDPSQALGFLAADPSQVQGNTELTTLVTRGQPSVQALARHREPHQGRLIGPSQPSRGPGCGPPVVRWAASTSDPSPSSSPTAVPSTFNRMHVRATDPTRTAPADAMWRLWCGLPPGRSGE